MQSCIPIPAGSPIRIFATILISIAFAAQALNPIIPSTGTFLCDPEGHQWADGKMYLYGSHDIRNDQVEAWGCSNNYHVYSSSDLITWTDEGQQFTWSSVLYAPDCAYKGGTYYLYFCLTNGQEWVATSTSPKGPFTNGQQISGISEIDPAAFVDDDGQAYYAWGQGGHQIGRLNTDMKSLASSTIHASINSGNFHEGSSLDKRNGIYYLVFADISRNGRPTCLGYGTSTTPLGPYTYRGVIIDNYGSDPGVWNNHGSIAQFNGQWYVFYHRSSRNSVKNRRACCEKITFNADGTIPEVPMTSQGAEGPITASRQMEAEIACGLSGNARMQDCSEGGEEIGGIQNGDYAIYRYINFGSGYSGFTARVQKQSSAATIEIRLETVSGTLAGTCSIPAGSGWATQTCSLSGATGTHTVYLKFTGGNGSGGLNWFTFTGSTGTWNETVDHASAGMALSIAGDRIRFSLPHLPWAQRMRLEIFDLRGNLVVTPADEMTVGGEYEIPRAALSQNGAGMFAVRLTCGKEVRIVNAGLVR
jgi:hypothetical protein